MLSRGRAPVGQPPTFYQTRKTTAIRRVAVRETGVSRHHGGPIEGPPETPRKSLYYRIEFSKELEI